MSFYRKIYGSILFMPILFIWFMIFFFTEVVYEFKDYVKTKRIQRDDGDWEYNVKL